MNPIIFGLPMSRLWDNSVGQCLLSCIQFGTLNPPLCHPTPRDLVLRARGEFRHDLAIGRKSSNRPTRSLVDLVSIGYPLNRNSGPFERFRPDLKNFQPRRQSTTPKHRLASGPCSLPCYNRVRALFRSSQMRFTATEQREARHAHENRRLRQHRGFGAGHSIRHRLPRHLHESGL